MTFDRDARNALQRTVASLRDVLREDVTDQLRRLGIQESGQVLDLDAIAGLTENDRHTGEAMRVLLEHYVAGEQRGTEKERRRAAHDRMAREIGFSNLNRLIAIRMAEERGIFAAPAVGNGFDSDGFKVYEIVANGALGSRHETYRSFIDALFDEAAIDLPALFDRSDIRMRVFPSEHALERVFSAINSPDIARLWREDEAIGWVYQYYNDPDERREMRQHRSPRNSRELAVRNQFFTPRYVVQFLSDNTLGRIWYEMRKGETDLTDTSRYLVRRKHPIWLEEGEHEPQPFMRSEDGTWPSMSDDPNKIWTRPNPDLTNERAIWEYAVTFNGYEYSDRFQHFESVADFANQKSEEFEQTGTWNGTFEELRMCLFCEQRRHSRDDDDLNETELENLIALNKAICERWDIEVEAIPHRPKKDPRRLRIMDPASGSCHFLLYAFDLLLTIYEEAYDDVDLGPRLQQAFSNRVNYQREIPLLILENNLHGIDIDARAVQIGSFALWLRAQRHWHELGVSAADRPRIRKTNIVTAEPMPGERDMLEEYLKTVDPRLWDLVREAWHRMELAGEAGSLLKIEESIREAVRTASIESLVPDQVAQTTFYEENYAPRQQAIQLATKDDIGFWSKAEERLIVALKAYAELATNDQRIQRRLFAGDAVQGFAFIDLCRMQYDVVLMNPPFGEATVKSKGYIDQTFPLTKNDLFAAFIERWLHKLQPKGHLGAITSRTGFFLTSFKNWRGEVLLMEAKPTVVADLGYGVLDAMVETAAYCMERAVGETQA